MAKMSKKKAFFLYLVMNGPTPENKIQKSEGVNYTAVKA
jgi:hypothetical protein